MFDAFGLHIVQVVADVRLRVRVGGQGPAVVMLHGHPRTHATWHQVAPNIPDAVVRAVLEDYRAGPLCRSRAWRPWADDLRGRPLASGHHVGEENPDDLVAALLDHVRNSRWLRTDHRPQPWRGH